MEKDTVKKIIVFTDGGSRGNPGPSAIGVVISTDTGDMLIEIGKRIGIGTNNNAEYSAILEAFNWLTQNRKDFPNLSEINFFLDSNLAMSQLNGLFKVKNAQIRGFIFKIRQKESELAVKITYTHIPREQNKKADTMVNLALDNEI